MAGGREGGKAAGRLREGGRSGGRAGKREGGTVEGERAKVREGVCASERESEKSGEREIGMAGGREGLSGVRARRREDGRVGGRAKNATCIDHRTIYNQLLVFYSHISSILPPCRQTRSRNYGIGSSYASCRRPLLKVGTAS